VVGGHPGNPHSGQHLVDHRKSPEPPDAANWSEYAVPSVASGNGEVVVMVCALTSPTVSTAASAPAAAHNRVTLVTS